MLARPAVDMRQHTVLESVVLWLDKYLGPFDGNLQGRLNSLRKPVLQGRETRPLGLRVVHVRLGGAASLARALRSSNVARGRDLFTVCRGEAGCLLHGGRGPAGCPRLPR
eukprot:scaffold1033_cov408-Prasinococcus_capsulatus_cf.AAC.4